MRNKKLAIFAIFVSGILSIIFIYSRLWNLNIGTKSYKLFVYMDNSFNLTLGTPVLMSGVRIGKVQDIYLESSGVVVVLILDKSVKVPIGSEVKISYKGLIGDLLVNIFRTNNESFYKDGDMVKGEGPISLNVVLEKMTKISEKLEMITQEISEAGIGKLIKNIEKFSSNINKTYVDIEEVLQDFKKDNYGRVNNVIGSVERSISKISKLFSLNFSFYPEIEFMTFNSDGEPFKLDGSLGVKLGKFYAKKRGFRDWRKGYTLKLFKDLGMFKLSLGILENFPGAGLEFIPIEYLSLGVNAYNINTVSKCGLDLFGRFILDDMRFKLKYGIMSRQLSIGLGYKF